MIIIEVFEPGATPRQSPNKASDPLQDRHLMTRARLRKDTRSARRFSIGHRTARRDIQLSRQITQTVATFAAARSSFSRRRTVRQLAASHRLPSTVVRATPKSP